MAVSGIFGTYFEVRVPLSYLLDSLDYCTSAGGVNSAKIASCIGYILLLVVEGLNEKLSGFLLHKPVVEALIAMK